MIIITYLGRIDNDNFFYISPAERNFILNNTKHNLNIYFFPAIVRSLYATYLSHIE